MDRTPVPESDFEYCLEVTRRSGSNLWLVGKALPKPRRALFVSAYASMRVIDDYVDDDFAVRPAADREATRDDAHGRVEAWLAAVKHALNETPRDQDAAALDARISRSLADCFGRSDLGVAPWGALARAMHRDIDEKRFLTWADFEDYCEGATVAPASIFLYVLAAKRDHRGVAQTGLPAAASDCARDMAIFCYLVHIARDVLKDAAQGATLITIPDEILEMHGLNREVLAQDQASIATGGLEGLIVDLIERALPFRTRGEAWRDRLVPDLGMRESMALKALFAVYCALHDRLSKEPGIALSKDPSVREALRREALAAAEVPV